MKNEEEKVPKKQGRIFFFNSGWGFGFQA